MSKMAMEENRGWSRAHIFIAVTYLRRMPAIGVLTGNDRFALNDLYLCLCAYGILNLCVCRFRIPIFKSMIRIIRCGF